MCDRTQLRLTFVFVFFKQILSWTFKIIHVGCMCYQRGSAHSTACHSWSYTWTGNSLHLICECVVVETDDVKDRNKSPHIFSSLQHLFKVTLLIFGELIFCVGVQPLTTLHVMILSGVPCHSHQWSIKVIEEAIMTSGCFILTLLNRVEGADFSNTWINCFKVQICS